MMMSKGEGRGLRVRVMGEDWAVMMMSKGEGRGLRVRVMGEDWE